MNERIKLLAEQAKKYALDAMIKITDKEQALKVYSESYDTKFAELIVKECTSVLLDEAERLLDLCSEEDNRKLADAYESGHYQCIDNIDMIETHFGVEE